MAQSTFIAKRQEVNRRDERDEKSFSAYLFNCVLPLIPAYSGYLSGASLNEAG